LRRLRQGVLSRVPPDALPEMRERGAKLNIDIIGAKIPRSKVGRNAHLQRTDW
jgi:hypothetical protein